MSEPAAATPAPLLLYVWGEKHGLPSVDPSCLAAASLLQATVPDQFVIVECNDPDISPSGQLPFLRDGPTIFCGFHEIAAHLNKRHLSDDSEALGDRRLTSRQLGELAAYTAFVEDGLADLVAHTLFSLPQNWLLFTRSLYASLLPIPSRYYVPSRLRSSIKTRLITSGIWGLGGEAEKEVEEERKRREQGWRLMVEKGKGVMGRDEVEKARKEFEKQKVATLARETFSVFSSALSKSSTPYFFSSARATTLDILLFSYLAPVLFFPLPAPVLSDLLRSSFPDLVAHSEHLRRELWPPRDETIATRSWPRKLDSEPTTMLGLVKSLGALPGALWGALPANPLSPTSRPKRRREGAGGYDKGGEGEGKQFSEAEKKLRRRRLWWIVLASVGSVAYLFASGILSVEVGREEEDDDYQMVEEEEEEDEDEDEDEEMEEDEED